MSPDHAEATVQGAEAPARERAAEAQAPAAYADRSTPDPEEGGAVKAGRAIVVLAVAAIAVAYTGISGRRRDDEKLRQWTNQQAIPSVALVSPRKGGRARQLVLPGNVEAFETASIHGQVSGYVSEWRKDIGAKVRQGDILAVVDTPELDQRIAVAQSELAKAKANLALARVTAARWNSLRASAAVSQQAADEKDSDAHAKAAEVEAAQSNVDRLKALKAFANIVAPFDGVVTARNVDVGSLVKADSNDGAALFTVADIHQMRVYVPVPQSYAAAMKVGMRATLELPEYPDRTFEATIGTTSHAIDRKSRSLLVELIAGNSDGALAPGAFTRVHFQLPPDPNAITLPGDALIIRDNATEVATLGPDDRIVLQKVRIARDLGSEVEITGGLSQDERVVAHPPDSIGDGEEVRVTEAAGETIRGASAREPAGRSKDHPKSAEEMAQTGRDRGE
jgi:membrane fusion protein, multidrug efflux system